MTVSQETLKKLAAFDSPTICNAIELFEIRPRNHGYMDHRIRAAFPELPPMVGFAATASFRSAAPPTGGGGYRKLTDQLEQFSGLPGPAVVVFQDLDDPPVGATFGEVMCSAYRAFGSAGLITSGAGRDLTQVRSLRYPVFIGSTICSHAYTQVLHLGEPVHVGGLMVRTGDLLHGDINGVTSIPVEIAAEVAEVAEEFVAAEQIVLDALREEGEKTIGEFNDRYRATSQKIQRIQQRVSRAAGAPKNTRAAR
jgi:regulator of RNase E activity RraA